ncbi:MAG TPA: DMT family transporter [Dehalococcoidia bacterium]|nr:DMT family transporter [Dehalococcoidia bacterium]
MTDDSRQARAISAMFALGVVWGASFLFIKVAVDETGPTEVAVTRIFFGTLAIGAYVLFTRRAWPRPSPRFLAQIFVLGLFGNVMPFALIAWGEEHIDSGVASVLNATVPIFTAVVAAIALDEERFTTPRALGLLLGFVGVAVLAGAESLDITDSNVLGQLAVVGAALCYGIAGVMLRVLIHGRDLVNVTLMQLGLSEITAIVMLLAVTGGSPDFSLSIEAWLCLIALGVFGTGIGYVAFVWMIEVLGSVRASLVTYIVPVIGLILGWLVLDESIGLNTVAGFLLIISGVAIVMRGQAPVRRPAAAARATVGE